MPQLRTLLLCAAALPLLYGTANAQADNRESFPIQVQFPPLMMPEAPRGGAHPVGGPAHVFIEMANANGAAFGLDFTYHTTGDVPQSDTDSVKPPLVSIPDDFATLYEAVATGPDNGGLAAAIALPISNGHPFGELLVAGLPFGLHPPEFASWLFSGGGLELQQNLYDEVFDGNVVVVPVALTSGQEAGYFPKALPTNMAKMCKMPWIVRWPSPAAGVWQQACDTAGVETTDIGSATRCQNATAQCPSDGNPVSHNVTSLTFGGFQPGSSPQQLRLLDQVDAYELNLPSSGILMMKRALGEQQTPSSEVDLAPIIDKAPHLYLGAWHQPLSYIELIVNRDVWDSLHEKQRVAFRTTGKAAMLETLSIGLAQQGEAIEVLRANGAQVSSWPTELLESLRAATEPYLQSRASALETEEGDRYRQIIEHMRNYQEAGVTYFSLRDAPYESD